MQRVLATVVVFVTALVLPTVASASDLIDRNATGVKLEVNSKGEALLTYHARGKLNHVLAWGAINAIHPTASRPQVSFKLDYAGGWGKYKRQIWRDFRNVCGAYRGPKIYWMLTACTAPDGTHWAIQQWQRALPNYGLNPTAKQAVWELRLSHWSGPVAKLDITMNWAFRGRWEHLFGTYTYLGKPVHGFRSTSRGVTLDTFGRNIYVDTFNSAYGKGWKRENSFLAHKGTGAFCYGFYSHRPGLTGRGEAYRATVIGPGVTPDAFWTGASPGAYNPQVDQVANEAQRALGDRLCRQS